MTSFAPNDVAFGELLLTLYVDASFSTISISFHILSYEFRYAITHV